VVDAAPTADLLDANESAWAFGFVERIGCGGYPQFKGWRRWKATGAAGSTADELRTTRQFVPFHWSERRR
jgi:hypothetical protein